MHGEYSHPLRLAAFNIAKEWSCGVTRQIALRLLDLNQEGVALNAVAREFVERVTAIRDGYCLALSVERIFCESSRAY